MASKFKAEMKENIPTKQKDDQVSDFKAEFQLNTNHIVCNIKWSSANLILDIFGCLFFVEAESWQ